MEPGLTRGDAAAHAGLRAADAGRHEAVIQGVVGVDLPAEELAVEVLEAGGIASADLEVDYRSGHAFPLF
jgi:hypothetical protein